MHARNRGLISADEQDTLAAATVLIAGVGGVGGRAAEVLTRLGVGALILADPDEFDWTNLNRQAASTREQVGRNKARVVAELCQAVNPALEVQIEENGITAANVQDLVAQADVVIDGTDFTQPALGLSLARTARADDKPVLLAVEVGFGGWITTFDSESCTFERFFGLDADVTIDDLERGEAEIPLWRWIGRLPRYVSLDELKRVQAGELEAPAIAPAVEMTSAVLATSAVDLLVGRPILRAPHVWHVDARERRSSMYRPRRWRFAMSALRARANGR